MRIGDDERLSDGDRRRRRRVLFELIGDAQQLGVLLAAPGARQHDQRVADDPVDVAAARLDGVRQPQGHAAQQLVARGGSRRQAADLDELAGGAVAGREPADEGGHLEGLRGDLGEPAHDADLAVEVAHRRVAQLHRAGELAVDQQRHHEQRAAAAFLEQDASRSRKGGLRRGEHGEGLGAGRGRRQPPARRRVEHDALARRVAPSVLHAGDHPQDAAVEGGDLAGRDAGERGQLLGDEARHARGVVQQKSDQIDAGRERRVEGLYLALQRSDEIGVGGGEALRKERLAAADAPGGDRGHDLVAQVAAMPAGTAIRGKDAAVGPAAHRVAAHAEQPRHVADAQPGSAGGRRGLEGRLFLHGPTSIGRDNDKVN